MTKCTFCRERVDAGRAAGLAPGVDADATPVCAVACIAGAIVFGDLDDPASRVRALIAATDAAPLAPECGTEPSVYYVTGDGPPPDTEPRAPEPADACWRFLHSERFLGCRESAPADGTPPDCLGGQGIQRADRRVNASYVRAPGGTGRSVVGLDMVAPFS